MGPDHNPFVAPATALLKVMDRLRDRHAEMTLMQAMFFLKVAQSPGLAQKALYEALGSNDSVSSRTLAILSDVGTRNTPGLDLVELNLHPEDRRVRLVTLSPKGKRLMSDITADLAAGR